MPNVKRGKDATKANVTHTDPGMLFKNLGRIKVNQGHAHLVVECPLLQATLVAADARRSIEDLYRKASAIYEGKWHSRPQQMLRVTWREIMKEANASINALWDVATASGIRDTAISALQAGVDPHAHDFSEELHAKLSAHTASLQPTRQKRQVIAIAAAAIGFGISIYNTVQIQQIKAELNKAAGERQLIAHAVASISTRTEQLRKSINALTKLTAEQTDLARLADLAQALTADLNTLVTHLTSVVNNARDRRVDVSLVNDMAWREELEGLQAAAEEQGLELAMTEPADIARLEASVSISDEGVLSLILPVPLFSPRLVMNLWEMQQLPIHTKEGWMQVETTTPYLATTRSPASVFFSMTKEEFGRCYPVAGANLCPPVEKTYKANRKLTGIHTTRCLYSLFKKWEEDTKRHCSLTFVQQEEDAMRLASGKFALFTSFPDDISFVCKDASASDHHLVPGLNIIDIPTNCVAETQSVFLTPHVNVQPTQTAHDKTLPYPEPVQIIANASSSTLLDVGKMAQEINVHFATSAAPEPAEGGRRGPRTEGLPAPRHPSRHLHHRAPGRRRRRRHLLLLLQEKEEPGSEQQRRHGGLYPQQHFPHTQPGLPAAQPQQHHHFLAELHGRVRTSYENAVDRPPLRAGGTLLPQPRPVEVKTKTPTKPPKYRGSPTA